jgi:hypothetical protein
LSALLTLGAVGSLAACGAGEEQVDEKTIVVKTRRAGFGTDWLYELKGKFEAAYAQEGYKVVIRTPDNAIKGDTLVKELALGYDSTKVDLYISTDAGPDTVGALGNYGVLVENIEESVYNQPAISYSGTEANYYYARPFRIGTSSYPYTIEATMASVSADSTYTIIGRWDSITIRGNTGFEQGKWYTVALTKRTLDSGQAYCELWVNGILTANNTLAASRNEMKETNRLETAQLGLSRSADCFKQDFAMIFDRVLSNEEIERYSGQPTANS